MTRWLKELTTIFSIKYKHMQNGLETLLSFRFNLTKGVKCIRLVVNLSKCADRVQCVKFFMVDE